MTMTRKEFLGSLAKIAAGATGVAVLAACGNSSTAQSDGASAGNCTQNGTNDTIGSNHGHVLMVPKADVVAGTAKSYDIMGTATHTHSVMVTAAMFTMLQANTTVTLTSGFDAASTHTHPITIACA